jgi:peptidylprolyl isomerase
MTRLPIALACLALALLATACGSSSDEKSAAPAATATPPETPAPTGDVGKVSPNLAKKPAIAKPPGDPPAKLVERDVVKGKGKAAKAGETVAVQYVGTSWSTGEQFDASWDRGQPFSFPLGAGQVIPGWDEGVAGMKVGGRRVLVIPPDLAYGDQPPPGIAPGETLVFVVDLKKIS